jgi:hypothetical protein
MIAHTAEPVFGCLRGAYHCTAGAKPKTGCRLGAPPLCISHSACHGAHACSMEPIRMYTAGAGSGQADQTLNSLNQRAIPADFTAIWPAYMLIPVQFDPA